LDSLNFHDDIPTARISIKGPLGEEDFQATIDTGAFKSLIPLNICKKLGLNLKEFKRVRSVSKAPVRVEIFWAELIFRGEKVVDTVIGFDLPVGEEAKEFEKALIGRDVLRKYRMTIDFKTKTITFDDC
jgi:predicted aspartyl protease